MAGRLPGRRPVLPRADSSGYAGAAAPACPYLTSRPSCHMAMYAWRWVALSLPLDAGCFR